MIAVVSDILDWKLSRSLTGGQKTKDLSGSFDHNRRFRVLVMLGKAVELSHSLTCVDSSNAFQVDPGYMLKFQIEMFKLILFLRSNP